MDTLFSGDPERSEAILSYYALAARELRTRMTYTPPPVAIPTEPAGEPAAELTSAELAAAESPAPELREDRGRQAAPEEKEIFLQVFFPLEDGGYDENRSARVALPTNGGWHKVTVDLPEDFTGGRLRVDPLDCCGLFDLAGIQVASRVLVDEPIWTCRSRARLDALQVRGTADLLPGARYLRIVSYGKDPRLILPEISLNAVGEPLQLEIWMRFHTDWSSLGTSLRLWAEAFNSLPMERAKLDRLETEHQRLETEHQRLGTEYQHLETEHGTTRSRAEAAEIEVQRLLQANAEAATRWEETRAALDRLEAEHGSTRSRAEAAEAEVQRLLQANAEATARWEKARTALDRLEITERDRSSLRKERLLLATELNCLRSEFDAARDKAESELGALRHQLASKQQEIQRAQEHLFELDGQYHTELGRRRSMQRSVYWKSTMPLRALGRLVTTGSLNKRPASQHPANGNGKDSL